MKLYPEAIVGTYIFDSKNRILMMRGPKWGRLWIIPGGHIEYGERIFDAVKREVMEEVGLRVKPIGVFRVVEDIFPEAFHKKKHFIYVEVICKALSSKVKIDNREVKECLWMDERAVRKNSVHGGTRKIILEYFHKKKAGTVAFIDVKI